jgi:hypothetical protein
VSMFTANVVQRRNIIWADRVRWDIVNFFVHHSNSWTVISALLANVCTTGDYSAWVHSYYIYG